MRGAGQTRPMANRLAHETSPYLRQHADNPVDWYPWGEEAFAEARRRDVPVLLSVGYSACHWCHVMAHESFEDADIAALMDELFVCVKVDREERPDVDAIYMEATVAMTGHGGWPMTVFLTPDGEPFFCGTYFPPVSRSGMPGFPDLLRGIAAAWRDQHGEVVEQAGRLTQHLRQGVGLGAGAALPGAEVLDQATAALKEAFDHQWGGFGSAPKFPQSMSIDFLLRRHLSSPEPEALTAALHSLDAMCAGGIYDHLGGGFARYSVDERWLVPHFEKMLYDNALLIRPYLHAWQVTGNDTYAEVVRQTIECMVSDFQVEPGAFASATDADSPVEGEDGHNEEGRFQTWTPAEVRAALGDADEAAAICEWYGITEEGNFEGRSIPHRPIGGFTRPAELEELRRRLAAAREARPHPGLDDKVLTEWNALFLSALADAAAAMERDDWRALAEECGEFLCRNLRREDGRWLRSWQRDGGARHLGYAQDHAALADAFTRLYELTGRRRWLDEAVAVADALIDLFWDGERGSFYTTGTDAEALITRPVDLQDGATPSPQSTAAVALLRLAPLADRSRYREVAESVLSLLGGYAGQHPLSFANVLAGIDLVVGGIDEVVVPGDRPDLVAVVTDRWHPRAVRSWGEPLDGPLWEGREDGKAYVCRSYACGLPATTPEQLADQLA